MDDLSGSTVRTAATKLAQPADAGGSPKMALYASAAPTVVPTASAAPRGEWPAPTATSGKPLAHHSQPCEAGLASVLVLQPVD